MEKAEAAAAGTRLAAAWLRRRFSAYENRHMHRYSLLRKEKNINRDIANSIVRRKKKLTSPQGAAIMLQFSSTVRALTHMGIV